MRKFRQLHCSFCGKSEDEVLKLVAGPRVYISDVCAGIANQIMNEPPADDQPPRVQPSVWRQLVRRARLFWRGGAAQRVGSVSARG